VENRDCLENRILIKEFKNDLMLKDVQWINVAESRILRQVVVNTIMNVQYPAKRVTL
jgi:hypothetical protein